MFNRILQFIEENRKTTMQVEFAFLCGKADFTERGLFNAYNAGIHVLQCSKLGSGQPVILIMGIEYDPAEDSGMHVIMIRTIDPDGRDRMKPIVINAEFEKTIRFYNIDVDLHPTFDRYGPHSVEIMLDGTIIASISLDIVETMSNR